MAISPSGQNSLKEVDLALLNTEVDRIQKDLAPLPKDAWIGRRISRELSAFFEKFLGLFKLTWQSKEERRLNEAEKLFSLVDRNIEQIKQSDADNIQKIIDISAKFLTISAAVNVPGKIKATKQAEFATKVQVFKEDLENVLKEKLSHDDTSESLKENSITPKDSIKNEDNEDENIESADEDGDVFLEPIEDQEDREIDEDGDILLDALSELEEDDQNSIEQKPTVIAEKNLSLPSKEKSDLDSKKKTAEEKLSEALDKEDWEEVKATSSKLSSSTEVPLPVAEKSSEAAEKMEMFLFSSAWTQASFETKAQIKSIWMRLFVEADIVSWECVNQKENKYKIILAKPVYADVGIEKITLKKEIIVSFNETKNAAGQMQQVIKIERGVVSRTSYLREITILNGVCLVKVDVGVWPATKSVSASLGIDEVFKEIQLIKWKTS